MTTPPLAILGLPRSERGEGVFIPVDFFRCGNCAEWLRSREVHRGKPCQCPYCGQRQAIPGEKKGFFGKLFILVGNGSGDVAYSLCPYCHSEAHTFGRVCHLCCRDLPPLVG